MKSSEVVSVRLPKWLLKEISQECVKINMRRRGEPFNRNSFILKAILDKISHINRSRIRPANTSNESLEKGGES